MLECHMIKEKLNSKTLTFILIGVTTLLLCGIAFLVMTNKGVVTDVFSGERKVEKAVVKIGEVFYQDFYYELAITGKARADVVKQLKDKDISISVEEILKLKEIDVKAIMDSIKRYESRYDWSASIVTIKPYDPFGATDFSVEVKLVRLATE